MACCTNYGAELDTYARSFFIECMILIKTILLWYIVVNVALN